MRIRGAMATNGPAAQNKTLSSVVFLSSTKLTHNNNNTKIVHDPKPTKSIVIFKGIENTIHTSYSNSKSLQMRQTQQFLIRNYRI